MFAIIRGTTETWGAKGALFHIRGAWRLVAIGQAGTLLQAAARHLVPEVATLPRLIPHWRFSHNAWPPVVPNIFYRGRRPVSFSSERPLNRRYETPM
ncbi:unnamed protein product [Lasius platythorax]|uniref:Uncharacterized protein n=1 Tax=Lasius platythorax TaxID=488582 RepID=A0AAV2N6M5_9HYME